MVDFHFSVMLLVVCKPINLDPIDLVLSPPSFSLCTIMLHCNSKLNFTHKSILESGIVDIIRLYNIIIMN